MKILTQKMNVLNVDINGNPTVISLFAGCGGSSLGYKMAGYKELLAIEWNNNAVETFKLNFPEVPIWKKDIREIKGQEILDFLNIKKGKLDLLDGSPPCQGFSTAGRRKILDKRNDLILENIRLIEELYPKIFVIENVSGMIKGKIKGLFIEYMRRMKSLDYRVKCKLMNAKYYNVPQSRQRVIFIGARKDLGVEPSYPKPNKKLITVKEAWERLNLVGKIYTKTSPKFKQIVPKMKQGEQGTDLKGITTGFQMIRLASDKVCCTISKTVTGTWFSGLIHPKEDRLLTINELKRLSSYPDDFLITGKFQEQWAQIGNSVPPLFMEAIAENIRINIIEKAVKIDGGI